MKTIAVRVSSAMGPSTATRIQFARRLAVRACGVGS
jgi:hypothetical protein